MTITSKQFIEMLNDAGYDTRSYSGRGMYGKQCVAITTDDNPMYIAACLMHMQDDHVQDDLLQILGRAQSDSMGCSTVHYFPRMEWSDDCYEDDEDE